MSHDVIGSWHGLSSFGSFRALLETHCLGDFDRHGQRETAAVGKRDRGQHDWLPDTDGDAMKTWISLEDLQTGDLPDVCVVTGEDADGLVDFTFRFLPAWTWLLLLFGVFPFLIATMFATQAILGEVPVRAEILERYHRRRRAGLIAASAGIVMLATALIAWQEWLAATGTLALFVGIVASRGFIGGRPDKAGVWVNVSRVHPKFVQALEARGQVRA